MHKRPFSPTLVIGEKSPESALSLLQGVASSGAEAGSHFATLPEYHLVRVPSSPCCEMQGHHVPDAIRSVWNGQTRADLELRKMPNWEICQIKDTG